MDLLAWWNLVFLLPGSLGLLFAALSAVGLDGGEDAQGDLHGDADAPAELPGEVEAAHGLDGHDLPAHGGLDGHDASDAAGGVLMGPLLLLGVGRVPLMILLTSLCLLFAFIGLGMNQLLVGALAPWQALPLSFVTALAGSLVSTSLVARAVGHLVPKEESYATSFAALAGQGGKIVLLVSPSVGYAHILDRYGNLQEVRCQSLEGKPLYKGQPVLVAEARQAERLCLVIEDEIEARRLPDASGQAQP
jgi:membrane protein implicated in regulation of membrane protease activity